MEEPLSIEITTETLDHGKSRIKGYFTVTIKYDTEGNYLGVETEEATPAPGKARLPYNVVQEIHNTVERISDALDKSNAERYVHLFSCAVFVINNYQTLNVLPTSEPQVSDYPNGAKDCTITYRVDGWA